MQYQTLKNKLIQLFLHPSSQSVLILTFFTGFSRLLGFVRQFFIYTRLEPIESDLLLSGNKVPDFLATFLLMGTVYSSILPIASKLESKETQENSSQYLNLMMLFLVSVIGFLALIIVIFTRFILERFTSPEIWTQVIQGGYLEEYILATRIMCLIPIFSAIQSIFGVFLNLKKRFLIFSLAGVVANLGTILGLILSNGSIVVVASFMVIGWVVADSMFLIQALKLGYKLPSFSFKKKIEYFKLHKKEIFKTWQLFLPRIFLIDGFYGAALMLNFIFSTGQNTAFDIGTSISGSFFILVTSLTTVAFPDLSLTLNSSAKTSHFWQKLKKYVLITITMGFGVTIIAFLFSPLIMWLFELLGKGQGNGDYIVLIAQISALSLVFRSGKEILSRYIFAKERVWQPVILSTVGVFFQAIFIFGLYNLNRLNLWDVESDILTDTGLIVTLSLVIYYLVWVLGASKIVWSDYKKTF
jgi:peptidoglycan biosynthesis protein MviN/MurJ (putative lipid II flippase)